MKISSLLAQTNLEHFILDCKVFSRQREEILKKIKVEAKPSRLNNLISKKRLKILSFVLGGDLPASGTMHAENVVRTTDFISAISRMRSAIIAGLIQ